MVFDNAERLQSVLQTVSTVSKSAAVGQVQRMLMPHILKVFAEHDHEDLERLIIVDYDLAKRETPPNVKRVLSNLGSNPEMRRQWEGIVLKLITPENIKGWLRSPEEWLEAEQADRQRAELQACAEVIEQTPGGEAWLERQVLDLYEMAGIVPQTAKAAEADD